jgi:transketolase
MNGNAMPSLLDTLKEAQNLSGKGKPIMILMTTAMGKGVDFMEGTHKWHGVAPNDSELANALSQLTETLGDY